MQPTAQATAQATTQPTSTPDPVVYIGTYTTQRGNAKKSEGIYVCRLEMATGKLSVESTTQAENPSFLTLDPQRRYLFVVNELGAPPGGTLSAFAIDTGTARLTFLNQQPTHGSAPCYVSVEQGGRLAMVANYSSGNLTAFPIGADGRLNPSSDTVQHQGSGPNPRRQEGPHAHSIIPDPANRFALAADLGIDKVMVYRMDVEQGKLQRHGEASVLPGSGPRHLTFHPNGRYVYLINEVGSTLTVFGYDAEQGTLETLQTVPTLPPDFTSENNCADVHVSPSGKFLYGSNRGHDSIVIYAIDESRGTLILVGHESTRGRTPRNFAIDPTGTYLLAANQDTDNIVTFKIDAQTGKLMETGHVAEIPMPVCVMFVPAM
jgi:6-phosphogluconolactonase